MPLPRTASLNCEKMYGDFVKCYDFAVHCFIMVALYCREGQAPPLRMNVWVIVKVGRFATSLYFYRCGSSAYSGAIRRLKISIIGPKPKAVTSVPMPMIPPASQQTSAHSASVKIRHQK